MTESLSRLRDRVVAAFHKEFGSPSKEAIFAWGPGRVNLIGEHTDYNNGFVFPMAIDRRVALLFEPAADGSATLFSMTHQQQASFSLGDLRRQRAAWINYVAGVAKELQARGVHVGGGRGVIAGDVPVGSGLSSSAALEVAAAFAFLALPGATDARPTGPEIAQLCQRAEVDFVGLNCGIMDQFISVLGKEGHALLLDCRDLQFGYAQLDNERYGFVIADSGVRRSLTTSAYNERHDQCNEAVALLKVNDGAISSLRDVSPSFLTEQEPSLPPLIYKRARHVVDEIARTPEAAAALEVGDYARFGSLMNDSHESLRYLYEVSCPELDRLVETARSLPGVLGSRLTGAGFGGCTVTLVEKPAASEVMNALKTQYEAATGIKLAAFFSTPAAGAGHTLLADL